MKRLLEIEYQHIPDRDVDTSYLEQEEFESRLEGYRRGDFGFIGVRAVAHIEVNGILQTVESAGLWGIEDDSDAAYLKEVEREERAQLAELLEALGFSAEEVARA